MKDYGLLLSKKEIKDVRLKVDSDVSKRIKNEKKMEFNPFGKIKIPSAQIKKIWLEEEITKLGKIEFARLLKTDSYIARKKLFNVAISEIDGKKIFWEKVKENTKKYFTFLEKQRYITNKYAYDFAYFIERHRNMNKFTINNAAEMFVEFIDFGG